MPAQSVQITEKINEEPIPEIPPDSPSSDEVLKHIETILFGKRLATTARGAFKYLSLIFLSSISLYFRIRMGGRKRDSTPRTDQADVYARYEELADNYDTLHSRTTNGRDVWWRREVAYYAAFFLRERFSRSESSLPVLVDICTGTGASVEEMFRIFNLESVHVSAIGIDINEAMLGRAKAETLQRIAQNGWLIKGVRELKFERGDAAKLAGSEADVAGFATLKDNSVSCTTNTLGVFGLKNSTECLKQQLRILEPKGIAIGLDLHRPLVQLTPSYPFNKYSWWATFEQMAWERVTLPLILKEFWAWEDPTLNFYMAPLLTVYDKNQKKHYGFKLLLRLLKTERWWFGLEVIPTATIILQKVEISLSRARHCERLLSELCQDAMRSQK